MILLKDILIATAHDIIWAVSWRNLFMPYVNKKDAGQPAQPCSLVFVFDSGYIQNFKTLASSCSWAGQFMS